MTEKPHPFSSLRLSAQGTPMAPSSPPTLCTAGAFGGALGCLCDAPRMWPPGLRNAVRGGDGLATIWSSTASRVSPSVVCSDSS